MSTIPSAVPTKTLWQWIIIIWLISRLGLLAVSFAGQASLLAPTGIDESYFVPSPLQSWTRWDANFYLDIATKGYPSLAQPGLASSAIGRFAFFPLYPATITLLSLAGISPVFAAFVISNIALLVALFLLFRLVEKKFTRSTARWAVGFTLAWPTAFIFSAPFSESLFFCFSVLSFLLLERGQSRWAALAAGLTTVTRPLGMISASLATITTPDKSDRAWRRYFSWLLIVGACFLPWPLINWILTGQPLFFLQAQSFWGHSMTMPFVWLFTNHWTWSPELVVNLGIFGLALVSLPTIWRSLPRTYFWLTVALLGLPLLSHLTSISRYSLGAWPLWIALGLIATRHQLLGRLLIIGFWLIQLVIVFFWVAGVRIVV